MGWKLCAAAAGAAVIVLSSWPADAQTRQRTRITVTKERSFLDPGTEVLPGERKYSDYATTPFYTPQSIANGISRGSFWTRQPLPDPLDFPGYWR
jgi:hypothetical protein